jgi:hypothetical protein
LRIWNVERQGGQLVLRWQGGSGLYQVQARNALGSGSWQNLESPTTNTVFTHAGVSPMFYRVQSLPNP